MSFASFEPGAVIARRFTVLRVLKRSEEGGAYVVRDDRAGIAEAKLKITSGRGEAHPHAERLHREHRVASQIRHVSVPAALDFGRDVDLDATWLLLEYAPGAPLDSGRPIDLKTATEAFVAYLRVFAHLHDRGVVHGDVKPSHLLRDEASGRATLIDFDLATAPRTTAPRGTPPFAPPEAVRGRLVDGRSDLWSLAASLRVAAGGSPPTELGAIVGPSPFHGTPLEATIAACLDLDPERRPADARAALASLRRAGVDAQDETTATLRARLADASWFGEDAARRRALSEIPAGRQRPGGVPVVVVRGPTGAGKSRLLRRLSAEWRAADVRVVRIDGAAAAGRGVRPFFDLLKRLNLAATDAAALGRRTSAERASALVHEAGSKRRTVFVVDDADLADRSFREILAQAARRAVDEAQDRDGSIAQWAIALGTSASPDDPLTSFVEAEAEGGGVVVVAPEPLSTADAARFAKTLARTAGVDVERAADAATRSGGLPGRIVEAVLDLAGAGEASTRAARPKGAASVALAAAAAIPGGASREKLVALAESFAPGEDVAGEVARLLSRGELAVVDGRVRAADRAFASDLVFDVFDEATRPLFFDAAADAADDGDDPSVHALRLRGSAPDSAARAAVARGAAAAAEGDPDLALRYFDSVLEAPVASDAARREAGLRAVDAALQAGSPAAAARRLRSDDADPEQRLRVARVARARGDADAAAAAYRAIVADPSIGEPAARCDVALEFADAMVGASRFGDAREALALAEIRLAPFAAAVAPPPKDVALDSVRGPRFPWPGEDAARCARYLTLRGEAAQAERDFVEAVYVLNGALKLAGRLRDAALYGRVLHSLGTTYLRAGATAAAERRLRRAAQVRADAGDAKGVADTANNLGVLYRRTNRTSEAVEQFTRSLRIRRRLGNPVEESASYLNLANVYFERRELEPATRYWRRALASARSLSQHDAQAKILNNLGAAAFLARRFEEALRCFEEAEVLARGVGRPAEAVERRLNAASVLVAAGDAARAERSLAAAERFAERKGVPSLAAAAALLRARAARAEGRRDAAAEILRRAVVSAEATPSFDEILTELAAAELACGRREAAEAALRDAQGRATTPEMKATVAALAVKIASDRGEAALRAAIPTAEDAALESERLRLPWSVFETTRAVADAWRRLGDHRRAATCFRRAFEALEGILRGFSDPWLLDAFCGSPDVAGFLAELEAFREETVRGRPAFPAASARDFVRRAKDAWFDADRALGGASFPRDDGVVARLVGIARKFTGTTPLDELLRLVVDAAVDFTGAERGFVVLVDDRSRPRIPCARNRDREPVLDPTRQISRRVADEALKREAPVRFDNAMVDGLLNSAASVMNLELRSVMCAPLVRNGETFGLLYVDHRSKVGRFDDGDLEILGLFALQASSALENHRIVSEFVRDEKLKLLGKLAGGVAHDFNNLLTAIAGEAQSGAMRSSERDAIDAFRAIDKVAREGAAVVRRLHDVSRTGRTEQFGAVDLREAIADAVDLTRAARERASFQGSASVEVRTTTPAGVFALGDAVEIREVLTNIALNGVAAMPAGGVLKIESGAIEGRVFVEIADEGVGMTEEVRERLFDPYFTTRGGDNVGLGMSVVFGIVARHQGLVRVESFPGQGTKIRVELPSAEAPLTAGATADVPPSLGDVERRASRRLLVVEDDAAVRRVMTSVLRLSGFKVVEAQGGPEALAALKAQRFDLVLTDLGMLPLSGWDVARAVKAGDPSTEVFLVTGWGAEIDQETARRRGVDSLIRKPFDVKTLVRLVEEGADRTTKRREAAASATSA